MTWVCETSGKRKSDASVWANRELLQAKPIASRLLIFFMCLDLKENVERYDSFRAGLNVGIISLYIRREQKFYISLELWDKLNDNRDNRNQLTVKKDQF